MTKTVCDVCGADAYGSMELIGAVDGPENTYIYTSAKRDFCSECYTAIARTALKAYADRVKQHKEAKE